MIRNLEELVNHVGAAHDTIEAIAHRVYKDTACGAWVLARPPGPRARLYQWWRAEIALTVVGLRVIGIAPPHKAYIRPCLAGYPETLPVEVAEYLQLASVESGWSSYMNLKKDEELGVWKMLETSGARLRSSNPALIRKLRFEVTLPSKRMDRGGVAIGSIVEGVDVEVGPVELRYPFSEEDWWEAVRGVEDEAQRIWDETHGCEHCATASGGPRRFRAVDPDCKECGGHGIII